MFPNNEVRSATALYNCAGLVFGSRRVVIGIEEVLMILRDDGYQIIEEPSLWRPGDVVLYRDAEDLPSHVAIVYKIGQDFAKAETNVSVISQWGETGEFLHDWKDVSPRLGKPREIWSERRRL